MSKTSVTNNDIIKAIEQSDDEYEDKDYYYGQPEKDEGPCGGAFASMSDFWNWKER